MDLREAKALALEELTKHNLSHWTFKFDNAKTRFGYTLYSTKTISLSKSLTQDNPRAQVYDTILHEIAHALAGPGTGHGPIWKAQALAIGCSAERQFTSADVNMNLRYRATCTVCLKTHHMARRPKNDKACATCCRTYAGNKFDVRFLLRWIDTKAVVR